MLHSDVQMSRRPWMAESDHQTRLGFPYVQKKPGDALLSQEGERGYSESTAFARANAVSVQASGRSLSEAKDPTCRTRMCKCREGHGWPRATIRQGCVSFPVKWTTLK